MHCKCILPSKLYSEIRSTYVTYLRLDSGSIAFACWLSWSKSIFHRGCCGHCCLLSLVVSILRDHLRFYDVKYSLSLPLDCCFPPDRVSEWEREHCIEFSEKSKLKTMKKSLYRSGTSKFISFRFVSIWFDILLYTCTQRNIGESENHQRQQHQQQKHHFRHTNLRQRVEYIHLCCHFGSTATTTKGDEEPKKNSITKMSLFVLCLEFSCWAEIEFILSQFAHCNNVFVYAVFLHLFGCTVRFIWVHCKRRAQT